MIDYPPVSSNMDSPGRSTSWFDDFPSELNLPFLSCFSLATFDYQKYILWIEEILHQLVDGLSHDNPIVHSASWLPNGYQLVQDFFHPPYVYDVFTLDCTNKYKIYIYSIYIWYIYIWCIYIWYIYIWCIYIYGVYIYGIYIYGIYIWYIYMVYYYIYIYI